VAELVRGMQMTNIAVCRAHEAGLIYRVIDPCAVVPIVVRPRVTNLADTIMKRYSRNIGSEHSWFGITFAGPLYLVSYKHEISRVYAIHPVDTSIMTDGTIINVVVFAINNRT
jgi:hypothetical protein